MGAWGPGSFDNDSAHDWLGDLGGIRDLRKTLERVIKAKRAAYIDVDDASAVIAAAEIVASSRGRGHKDAPEEIGDWLDAHGSKLVAADAKLAAKAVTRIQASSELQELWSDHGAKNPWTREVRKLLSRLTAPKKPLPRKKKPKPKRAPIVILTGDNKRSPDGKLVASVSTVQGQGMCQVIIEHSGGGGGLIALYCELDDIRLRWIDDDNLEVTYPKTARINGPEDDLDETYQYYDRIVAIHYVKK